MAYTEVDKVADKMDMVADKEVSKVVDMFKTKYIKPEMFEVYWAETV